MRLVITGATGFVGRHLVPSLSQRGHEIHAITRRPAAFADRITVTQIVDIGADVDWQPLFAGADAVVHLAALAHATSKIEEDEYRRVNTLATARIARAAQAVGARFIYISSVAAQTGSSSEWDLTENDPPRPVTAYGRSKLAAELQIESISTRYVILRPTLTFGESVGGNMQRIMRLSLLGVPPPLGAVHNRRSILSVENLCDMVDFVLGSDAAVNQVILASDQQPVSTADMVRYLRLGAGMKSGGLRAPAFVVGGLLQMLGQGETWKKIGGNLPVSVRKLQGLGFRWRMDTATALQRLGAHAARSSQDLGLGSQRQNHNVSNDATN